MSQSIPPYAFDTAIVRSPAASVVDGLRDGNGPNPDFEVVCHEHAQYVEALKHAGVNVVRLPALDAFPDSVFVEDPALVFSQGAIELRPGALSRQGEVAEISSALREQFDVVLSLPAGYADGGDMLLTPKGLMIGLSARTDEAGAKALQTCLSKFNIASQIVATPPGVLHFKSDCSLLDEETVLSTQRLASSGVFDGFKVVLVPDGEEAAANALRVNDSVLTGKGYALTNELLDKHGYNVVALPTDEIAKVDAGLSCMSLRWKKA
ncbi:MAG: dimethylarginine dimethylaminohydrolase family protein [Gammaproteobacteria bacterium]